MNKYRIVYRCNDGYEGEEIVYAVNRTMAFMVFEDFRYEDIVSVDCFRIIEE